MKKLNEVFHTPNWLFWILAATLLFRIPSLFEPYSYGDEMIYLTLGEGIRQRIPLYLGLHDNKPPLLYITAAVAGNLFFFRAILTVWVLVTIYIFWRLVEHFFPKNERLQKSATIIFALLTTIPSLEGNIANSELFMIGPTMLGFLLLFKNQSAKSLLSAGLLFSVATMYKVPAAFDIPAIIAFWLFTQKLTIKNLALVGKRAFWIALGFALPLAATFIYYYLRGAINEYLVAAWLQNFGYLSSWRPADVVEPFWVKNGPLLARGAIVAAGMAILFVVRNKVSKPFLFVTAWLLFGLFAVTLSERPYPHYLVQVIPAVSILVGMLFANRSVEQVLVIAPLTLFFFVPVYYKFWYYPTASYYVRFAHFVTGNLSLENYRASFGGNVNRNYDVAKYIGETTQGTDRIFVWGDNSTIYALSRRLPPFRYVVDYHIKDFFSQEATIQELSKNKPRLIVILPAAEQFDALDEFVASSYALAETIDGAQIWRALP